MTAHLFPTCAACLAPLDSLRHDAECVAPLVVLCGESPVVERDSRSQEPSSGGSARYDNGDNEGPGRVNEPDPSRHRFDLTERGVRSL
jgi:hypothetical protein